MRFPRSVQRSVRQMRSDRWYDWESVLVKLHSLKLSLSKKFKKPEEIGHWCIERRSWNGKNQIRISFNPNRRLIKFIKENA